MNGKPIIETVRLVLREYTPEDFDALFEIMSDEETMRHYPAPFDGERTRGWIDWNIQNYREYGFGLWAIIEGKRRIYRRLRNHDSEHRRGNAP